MAEGGGDQHVRFGAKLVADRLAGGKIRLLEPQIFRRWGRQADPSLSRSVSGAADAVEGGPGQAGALNGSCGGKAQSGNMSLISRARSRRR